ncbi:MAG: putative peptidoglycan lipid flippase [Chthoniobacter sp.]|jgi:putative peptidoglycan lipid II flippase|nr:putative peptidoglycan lipid flippase [Chthoniobacter sp.]
MSSDPAAGDPANPVPAAALTPTEAEAKANKVNTKAAGVVGLAVMCSRVLGLIREQVFAWLFGGGKEMDAFIVAFRTPNLLRDLFAEGALSTAFVTTFTKKIATEGEESAWRLANKVTTLTAIFMSGVVVVGILVAPLLVRFLAPGFTAVPGKAELTVHLAQLMYPFILLVSLGALVMGILNARNVFGVPAMASSFFNIGSIVGGVTLGWLLDPSFGPKALIGLALGTVIGGVLQLGVQLPSLRRAGYRYRPDFQWNDPGVHTILRTMGPAIIAASSVQVNVMVNTWFASWLEDGTAYRLNIAFRLMQLPLGIFGVAIGTVTLPLLSRIAATGDREGFGVALARGMRLAFVLTVPATVGLILLARPIISLLYEHGKFSAHATDQAAIALQGYAIGLCAYSALKILMPAFYAIDQRRTPMMVSFLSIGLNVLVNWFLAIHLKLEIRGLALGTGCVAMVNFLLLYALMRRQTGSLGARDLLVTLGKLAIASGALAAVCWAAQTWLLGAWLHWSFVTKASALLGVIGLAGAAYFLVAMQLRIAELDDVLQLARRKFGRFAKR